MPRTIRLDLAYDGTGFVGWQRQGNGSTVQAAVEDALAAACGAERVVVHGASRTDAGVHARGQVASAQVDTRLDDATLRRALNARLPSSVDVRALATVEDDFHARFSARGKHYGYRIREGERRDPFDRVQAAWTRFPLDLAALREGARHLVGSHDFAAFATAGSPRASTVREVYAVHAFSRRGVTTLGFCGNGFLYNQVRAMVGTLLLVGWGKLAPGEVRAILASRDRRRAGPTAPPEGLVLLRVLYGGGRFERSAQESEEEDRRNR